MVTHLTYKNLYSQVAEEIEKRLQYRSTVFYPNQGSRAVVEPFVMSSTGGDVSANEILASVYNILQQAMPPQILEGLEVTADTPPSTTVTVHAGKGSVGGYIYILEEDVDIDVPLNDYVKTWYVKLYKDRILVEQSPHAEQLTIAKIIVPQPGLSDKVIDTKDDTWDAYIQSFKEYKLYGMYDKFEEDTVELLRDNFGLIMANQIIGTLTLTENMKIVNEAGTLALNSNSLLLKDFDGNVLSRLDKNGVYFFQADGGELAKFTVNGSRIGNIVITPTSIESGNYEAYTSGFKISDTGDAEFNQLEVRGTIYATGGVIGGWTISGDSIYAGTEGGVIKTGETVGTGSNGVILDEDGLRVYDAILGVVVNLPSDGSAPTFSSGIISSTIWNIDTSSIIRTSATTGDGTANSAGILINSTGMYGMEANQIPGTANFKVLADGSAYFKGELQATSGVIGGVTISGDQLIGGSIIGSLLRGTTIETSATLPRVRIDDLGLYYQVASNIGKYAEFKYGDGSHYGTGVLAYLFNANYPVFSVVAHHDKADIRLFNRDEDPGTDSGEGPFVIGDIVCVDGYIKSCIEGGVSSGVFKAIGSVVPNVTADPDSPVTGEIWFRTDI